MKKNKLSIDTKNELAGYYRGADKYSERLESHSASAYAEYIEFVKRFIPAEAKLMDAGCGTGLPAFLLAKNGYDVIGIDLSSSSIKRAQARERANLKFFCADSLKIPFKNEIFDCVATFLVIEHIPDIPQFIEEMLRVTKHGGRIIILSPNLLSPFNILLPLLDSILCKKANFLFGVDSFWGMIKLLCRHTGLLIKKKLCCNPEFTYRQPILENRVDFIADNDSVYLACPIDFKRYFEKMKGTKIENYQGYGRIGKIFPDLATGIHLAVRKL